MGDSTVRLFDIFEQAFEHVGTYDNPYLDVQASVALTGPDGETRSTVLFWDGNSSWRLRFSPDRVGQW